MVQNVNYSTHHKTVLDTVLKLKIGNEFCVIIL